MGTTDLLNLANVIIHVQYMYIWVYCVARYAMFVPLTVLVPAFSFDTDILFLAGVPCAYPVSTACCTCTMIPRV
jgi:hypothetical protein